MSYVPIFTLKIKALIKESIMNCFSVWKQDDTEKLAFLPDLFPLLDSLIRLNLRIVGILNCLFNSFYLYFSTIRSLFGIEKIFGKFHLLFSCGREGPPGAGFIGDPVELLCHA